MSVGKRIAEERKRMGFSQSVFAELVGVSFSSQRRYEDGTRSPDTAYLESLRKQGMDVNYVLFNLNGDEVVDCPYVAAMALLPGFVYKPITQGECRDMAAGVTLRACRNSEGLREWFDACQSCALNPGKFSSRKLDRLSDSDVSLLEAVLEGVDTALQTHGMPLSHAKKAQAVAMLYRAFKASGKVDTAMIEEAVKLAS